MSDPVLIRPLNPAIRGELAFLYSTWLRTLRELDNSGLEDDHWFAAHRAHIEDQLADPGVVALVAAASDDPAEILGYVVARPNTELLWITVKRALRGHGLAKRLLEAAACPPGTPARWRTPDLLARLSNPPRSRRLRQAGAARPSSEASPSRNSRS